MWAQLLSVAIGVWMMAAPTVLDYGDPARTNDWIVGPLAATFSVIAMGQATRDVRLINIAIGGWWLIAPWVLGYDRVPLINSLVAGLVLIGLSLVRGTVTEKFGGGWSMLWSGGEEPADAHQNESHSPPNR